MKVNWPESEPIPESLEEALALGWQIEGIWDNEMSRDQCVQTGYLDVTKDVGMLGLCLKIPFRAEFSYGKPCIRHALICVTDAEPVRA
jgi:hypothetical protein